MSCVFHHHLEVINHKNLCFTRSVRVLFFSFLRLKVSRLGLLCEHVSFRTFRVLASKYCLCAERFKQPGSISCHAQTSTWYVKTNQPCESTHSRVWGFITFQIRHEITSVCTSPPSEKQSGLMLIILDARPLALWSKRDLLEKKRQALAPYRIQFLGDYHWNGATKIATVAVMRNGNRKIRMFLFGIAHRLWTQSAYIREQKSIRSYFEYKTNMRWSGTTGKRAFLHE